MAKSKGGRATDPGETPPPPDPVPELAVNPVVAAAQQAVVALFDTLADEWPKTLKPPAEGPMPHFTDEMVKLMRDQLRRALGLEPVTPQK
ncbi:MAG: hypothetical protein JF588_06515 [Caulobacterales bacterium]|nr:hypothetical protein [Caulobacterales bacterium]